MSGGSTLTVGGIGTAAGIGATAGIGAASRFCRRRSCEPSASAPTIMSSVAMAESRERYLENLPFTITKQVVRDCLTDEQTVAKANALDRVRAPCISFDADHYPTDYTR